MLGLLRFELVLTVVVGEIHTTTFSFYQHLLIKCPLAEHLILMCNNIQTIALCFSWYCCVGVIPTTTYKMLLQDHHCNRTKSNNRETGRSCPVWNLYCYIVFILNSLIFSLFSVSCHSVFWFGQQNYLVRIKKRSWLKLKYTLSQC